MARPLQERAVMDSDSEMDPSLTNIRIYNFCTGKKDWIWSFGSFFNIWSVKWPHFFLQPQPFITLKSVRAVFVMQCFYFQLESVCSPPTVGTSHKHHARLLQSHDSIVVAAVVCTPVLHALVSPYMSVFIFGEYQNCSDIKHTILSVFLQSATGCILSTPQARSVLCPVQPAQHSEPAATGSSCQSRGPDECSGRGDPERGGAEPGLAGLGVHVFTCCHLTQHRLLLLLLQPLCHGDDGHASALPVSGPACGILHIIPSILHCSLQLQLIKETGFDLRTALTWSWHCFCAQASGRLVPLQPGEWAPASRRPSQSRWDGGRATKPRGARNGSCCRFFGSCLWQWGGSPLSHVCPVVISLSPAGRSNGRRLRRWRGKWRGGTRRPKQRPPHRLPVLHVVVHHNLLHVAHPWGAAERCELNLELNHSSPQEDEAPSCSWRLFVLQCSVRVSHWSTSLHI